MGSCPKVVPLREQECEVVAQPIHSPNVYCNIPLDTVWSQMSNLEVLRQTSEIRELGARWEVGVAEDEWRCP